MSRLNYAAIRAQIPIRRVLELLDWKPTRRRGDQWRGQCPLLCSSGSNRKPRFSVHVSRHLFQCFTCHHCGNQLDLWAAATTKPLHPATLDLCHRLGVEPVTLGNPQPRDLDTPAT